MNCKDDKNINILEEIIKNGNNPKITLLPMIALDEKITPLWDYEIVLKKINIKQAYEIGKGDLEAAAILKDDDPIIPRNIKNPPIKELLKTKQENI